MKLNTKHSLLFSVATTQFA